MKNKIKIISISLFVLLVSVMSVLAVDFIPQGDINGVGIRSIVGFINISSDYLYGVGSLNNVTGCSNTQVLTYNSSSTDFYCSSPAGSGTVTSIVLSTGLIGTSNPIIGVGNISVNTTYLDGLYVTGTEANLNVNHSTTSTTSDSTLAVAWSAITDKFITAVDSTWFYMTGSTLYLNETTFNTTGDVRWIKSTEEGNLNVNHSDTSNSSSYWDNIDSPLDFSIVTASGLITGSEFSGSMNSSFLQNTPVACSTGNAVTEFTGATTVCSAFAVESTAVTFTTVDTGEGANELFDMDQNVLQASDVLFADLNVTSLVIKDTNSGISYVDGSSVVKARTYWNSTDSSFTIEVN